MVGSPTEKIVLIDATVEMANKHCFTLAWLWCASACGGNEKVDVLHEQPWPSCARPWLSRPWKKEKMFPFKGEAIIFCEGVFLGTEKDQT